MIPNWLSALSLLAILTGCICALVMTLDILRRPQPMGIMNAVWPITGLYAGPLGLWFYFQFNRAPMSSAAGGHSAAHHGAHSDGHDGAHHHDGPGKPFPVIVATGSTHCGAGCTLGDIIAESLAFAYPAIAVWFGWHSLFDDKMFAVWLLDFVVAFALGIAFQYFAITPMRNLSLRDGLIAALKADTLSLISWQIGMYGFMAFAQFELFATGPTLTPAMPAFWFIMQIAMLCGFVTSYPVNWWLIRVGIKEEM
ncbi:MAG: DUF4396 domain-containing protein [Rhodopseudomonas sp.]|nr:DUF4396 domain-containing protein [Rhodopseudomonas sp.]